jgi:hypothetical protein
MKGITKASNLTKRDIPIATSAVGKKNHRWTFSVQQEQACTMISYVCPALLFVRYVIATQMGGIGKSKVTMRY